MQGRHWHTLFLGKHNRPSGGGGPQIHARTTPHMMASTHSVTSEMLRLAIARFCVRLDMLLCKQILS